MQIVFSLSKISEDLYWTRYSGSLNPLEMSKMCRKLFGDDVNLKNSPIGTLKTRTSEMTFVPSGEEGVIALYRDEVVKSAKDFQNIMKPMPVKTPFGAGDFYLAIEGKGRTISYLVWHKEKDQLVYFPDVDALQDFYEALGVSPGVERMKSYPSRRVYGG